MSMIYTIPNTFRCLVKLVHVSTTQDETINNICSTMNIYIYSTCINIYHLAPELLRILAHLSASKNSARNSGAKSAYWKFGG